MNSHDDPGPVRYHLQGFRDDNEQLALSWEIPVRLWPLMGAVIGKEFDDGKGEYEISFDAASMLAKSISATKNGPAAHPYCTWFVGASSPKPQSWKNIWLDTAAQLNQVIDMHQPHEGRIGELLVGYIKVTRSLLYADVNGACDEDYADVPEAPAVKNGNGHAKLTDRPLHRRELEAATADDHRQEPDQAK